MTYIPSNRCTLNLKTERDTWVYKDQPDIFYNGDYWKLYTGQAFTHTGPNDTPSAQKEIMIPSKETMEAPESMIPEENYIPLSIDDPDPQGQADDPIPVGEIQDYLILKKKDPFDNQVRSIPYTYYPQPTEKDYKLGIFLRYFVVKINEDVWLEVDKTTYEKILSKDQKNWVSELYRPIKFMWTLYGTKKHVYKVNEEMVKLYEKKAGYQRGKVIQTPRRGLQQYLLKKYTKFRIGNTIQDVNSAFLVKNLNNLTFLQLYKVTKKAEYILSGKESEWLNSTKLKANEKNRSVYEQACFEANWTLYKEPQIIQPEESRSKTIWRVARELKLNEDRKTQVVKKADYIMLDTYSDWYMATKEKAEENDRPIYDQAMREANWVLYDGNPEHKAKVKQKQEINKITKELKLINPAKDWIKEKALYIIGGEDKKWKKKTIKKRQKWNKNNPDDQRTLLYQCFKEAQWLWDNKESKNRKYN